MPQSKQFIEAPRFVLPRLTWNGSFPRTTVCLVQTPTRRQQLSSSVNNLRPSSHQLHTSTAYSFFSHSSLSATSQITLLASRSARPTSNASSNPNSGPIRYNGVYVATFKPARRAFHTSAAMQRDHHFDTLKFVQRLKSEGFSEEQATAMMKVLNDVIQESIQNLTRTMVLKEGQLDIIV